MDLPWKSTRSSQVYVCQNEAVAQSFALLNLCGSSSDSCPLVAGHQNAVHGDWAALPRRHVYASGVVVDARPLPVLRALHQTRLDRVQMYVLDLFVVLLHG